MRDSFTELSHEELLAKKEDIKKRYHKLCFDIVVGHVDNPLEKRAVRRKLARLNTIIHEFKLGIRK